jgi:hypothetical protein
MFMTSLDPCVVPPVETPVAVEALANTGIDGSMMIVGAIVAAVLLAAGIFGFLKARTIRGKLASFVIPALLLGGLGFNSPQPAFATPVGVPGAPSVISEASIVTNWYAIEVGSHSISVTTEAVFENPELCGVLSYQWQTKPSGDENPFVNYGPVVYTTAPAEVVDCVDRRIQLLTTLTNSSGSATSISNATGTCD